MNGMMTGALAGAALIGDWREGAAVAFLYAVSNWLEGSTLDRARRSIRGLLDLAPREARIRQNGAETVVPVEALAVGDVLLVRPGEKLASDGVILAGSSALDEAPVTGESVPLDKGEGDPVYAGSLNGYGALEVRVTRRAQDTTLARIIHLVEQAQAQRAPVQRLVDRFARVYTPAVFALAVGLMVVPPLGLGWDWSTWFYRGLALLIVACPCALVVSTPVAVVSGIAAAARQGILIKGGAYLEEMGRLRAVALDKTGTLTWARPEVTDVIPLSDDSADQVLALAAAVEAQSEHPLARAVVRAARGRKLRIPEGRNFTAIPGKGGIATVGGETVYVGSPRLLAEAGHPAGMLGSVAVLEAQGKSVMLVGTAARLSGLIGLADRLRPESRRAVAGLRAEGIRHVALITGDNRATAEAVAAQVGADTVRAEVLPEQKLEAVRALRAEFGGLAMVGDGVNDAPALAAASVGVAMGVAGSDVALETADVALMADDLGKLPFLMQLGKRSVRVIRQNIAFALLIKAVAIAAVFPGWLTLWLAVLGDMGASVLVTLNGMRLLLLRPRAQARAVPDAQV
jgi:Cd2+/Zn2+-exporting ATPase